MIQILENFLRPYVERNPSKWTQHLALAEFAANNAVSTANGYSPFYLNGGEHPIAPSTFLGMFGTSQVVAVQEMVDQMKAALENVKLNLTAAQIRMKEYADRSQWSETFRKGTEVLLSTKNLRVDLHLPSKLRRRWIEPYKVIEVISPVVYRLDLPRAWLIHLVFHVSNMKRFNRSTEFVGVKRSPSSIVIEGEEYYEVEGILRHKGEGASRRYLVLWKGYPLTKASWEHVSHLKHAPLILEEYLRKVTKSGGLQRRAQQKK